VIDSSGGRNIINLQTPQGAAAPEAGSATVGAIVPTPAPAGSNAADKGTQP
jgi:membrane protease subunit HflK